MPDPVVSGRSVLQPPQRAVRRLALVSVLVSVSVLAALALTAPPAAGVAAAETLADTAFRRAAPADFSRLDTLAAFERMHETLARQYAFTDWKQIDWPALRAKALPAFAHAARTGNPEDYRLALQAYVAGIDDGHVSLPRNDAIGPMLDRMVAAQSGGAFGLSLAELDDGRIIVAAVALEGPAAAQGVAPGMEVLRWNGQPVGMAIDALDLGALTAAVRVATDAHRRLERLRLMTHAPAGTAVALDLVSPATGQTHRADLVARADPAPVAPRLDDGEPAISVRRIGDHGVIRLTILADLAHLDRWPEEIWATYAQAITDFGNEGVRGLVLDIRGNHGGWDLLAMRICGTLRRTPAFYESTEIFDAATGGFRRITVDDRSGEIVDALTIAPEEPAFRGPVVALIDPMTISSGEGLARCVAELPNGATVGFHGTRGSFGLAGGEIALPGGNALHYPDGRAVDRHGTVLIDSRHGTGGVAPAVRVPASRENVLARGRGEDPEMAAALSFLQQAAQRPAGAPPP